jgi:hypothetical protein
MTSDAGGSAGRPVIHVEPEPAYAVRRQLFGALAEAFRVKFVSGSVDPTSINARVTFQENTFGTASGSPILAFVGSELVADRASRITFARTRSLPPCLWERTLEDHSAGSVKPLTAGRSEEILAHTRDGPIWVNEPETAVERVVATLPFEVSDSGVLRDHFKPGTVLPLLPLVVFLNRIVEQHGLRPPPLRAAIVIDDPNLHRPTYGFIDFRRLALLALREGFHVGFSTIPLDGWLLNRRAAEIFNGAQTNLSLHVHGNNHLFCELERSVPDSVGLAEMAQAIRRIDKLERRSGLAIPKVMVPPHGRCSRETIIRMSRVGFEAICMSSPVSSFTRHPQLTRWQPALMVEGFPVLPRHAFASERDEFVFRALLGQPLIAYGHHKDAAEGLEIFSDVARHISSLGNVRWMNLANIARTNVQTIARTGTTVVRLYSRDATIELPDSTNLVIESVDEACDVRIHINGRLLLGPGPHELEGPARARIVTTRHDAITPKALPTPLFRPWPAVRRALTEARDRLQPLGAWAHPSGPPFKPRALDKS